MKTLLAIFAGAAFIAPALATVNVNTAQQSELESTRGLDKAQAKQIIVYRNENGPYRSLDDVAKALGPDTAQKIAPEVAFEGPAYIPSPHAEKPKKAKKKRT